MQITHLGHAAVLVEAGGGRILIDPGNFSHGWHRLTGLDGVLVTHRHPDHVDPEHIGPLLEANPDAVVAVEAGILEHVDLHGRALPLHPGDELEIGDVRVRAVGGTHAEIHRDIPRIPNVGLVLTAPGEPTFFHPGDELDATPEGVDVVAVPMMGPWAAMKEHIDFLRALGAPEGFGIHEGLLSERGWNLAQGRYSEMTPTTVHDLRGGQPWRPATR